MRASRGDRITRCCHPSRFEFPGPGPIHPSPRQAGPAGRTPHSRTSPARFRAPLSRSGRRPDPDLPLQPRLLLLLRGGVRIARRPSVGRGEGGARRPPRRVTRLARDRLHGRRAVPRGRPPPAVRRVRPGNGATRDAPGVLRLVERTPPRRGARPLPRRERLRSSGQLGRRGAGGASPRHLVRGEGADRAPRGGGAGVVPPPRPRGVHADPLEPRAPSRLRRDLPRVGAPDDPRPSRVGARMAARR